jgi:glycosyltransferase involved in cell wall biosynthesis
MKGTTYIENALNRLQKENYKFKFVLCENMNNNEVRRLLSESTIVIDQLILPGYGLFAVEAMASGNVVLGSTVPGVNEIPKEIPIIPTTPDDIYENLKRVLTARETWKNLILKGREYVERHHDYRKTSKNILEIIKKKIY